jgi:hypothetical protein
MSAGWSIKTIGAIKKQFTRPVTGSLAKFKVLLEDNLQKNRINAGRVIRIAKDSVIIAEEFEDESGTMTIKNIELKLYNKK